MDNMNMKRAVFLFFSTLIFVSILACSGEEGAPSKANNFNTPENKISVNDESEEDSESNSNKTNINKMNIKIGSKTLKVTFADNSSAEALKAELTKGSITINMQDYGNMEKVGNLGLTLPRNDEQINAEAGDVILYQGNAIVIYYAPNSWSFTRLGKINNITGTELKEILGDGSVTITLELAED